ncbi:MAG: hypothetical protein U1E62_26630 [Alsobacter sp.]
MSDITTKAEFARRRGVSRAAVTGWAQQGLLGAGLRRDGKIDVVAAEASLAAKITKPDTTRPAPETSRKIAAARATKLASALRKTRRKADALASKYIHRDALAHCYQQAAKPAIERLVQDIAVAVDRAAALAHDAMIRALADDLDAALHDMGARAAAIPEPPPGAFLSVPDVPSATPADMAASKLILESWILDVEGDVEAEEVVPFAAFEKAAASRIKVARTAVQALPGAIQGLLVSAPTERAEIARAVSAALVVLAGPGLDAAAIDAIVRAAFTPPRAPGATGRRGLRTTGAPGSRPRPSLAGCRPV